ncbi:hypothetical protein ACFWJE_07070 [Streptomyces griseoincarnatus]
MPELEALADAYGRVRGPSSDEALDCRAQAARCRGELGQVTEALAGLNGVLDAVRAVDGDGSENAVELRRDIGMPFLAQQRAAGRTTSWSRCTRTCAWCTARTTN